MSDRGQLYGDGFFETMLIIDGRLNFAGLHYERMLRTAEKLKLLLPSGFSEFIFFKNFIQSEISDGETIRLRMNVIRNPGGFYLPSNEGVVINFQKSDVHNPLNILRNYKSSISIGKDVTIFSKGLFNFKTLARSEQVLLSLEMKKNNQDDLLVLNEHDEIVECISSNIFFIDKNDIHFTPALSSGCLDGVFRKYLLDSKNALHIKMVEKTIGVHDLQKYKAVYTTNAVQGIIPVLKINEYSYNIDPVYEFMDKCDILMS